MQLLELHNFLIDSFEAVEANKPALARMSLNSALALLRPIKNDYADIRDMYEGLLIMRETIKDRKSDKYPLLHALNSWIELAETWIEVRVA